MVAAQFRLFHYCALRGDFSSGSMAFTRLPSQSSECSRPSFIAPGKADMPKAIRVLAVTRTNRHWLFREEIRGGRRPRDSDAREILAESELPDKGASA